MEHVTLATTFLKERWGGQKLIKKLGAILLMVKVIGEAMCRNPTLRQV